MSTNETAYAKVEGLVNKFKSLSSVARRTLNEDNTRKDFILPLFRALEWDIENSAEVSAEERVSRGWVDFSFRINGIPRFFLETKKVSEDLTKIEWVHQAVDYAWTKGVTWAVLSDFEGLRVFNAEVKEANPVLMQFVEFSVDDYLTKFNKLWWLSRPAMAEGILNQEAENWGKVKKEPVSRHLFDDLKAWRSNLYRNLKGHNPNYSSAQVDEAVLRLLNRLIFIRTAEDRHVEEKHLLPLLRDLEKRNKRAQLPMELVKLFRKMDAIYNSDLFSPHFLEKLMLECEWTPFRDVIEGLYEKPGSFVRYNFNAIDADVLGTAYEQYLGHIITQSETSIQEAHVQEKRQKRKSQGIFYTPTFVVNYIVQETVGRWLQEHGNSSPNPPHILDMACGSGSFLTQAFDVLERSSALQFSAEAGEQDNLHRLKLLRQSIYGVDKDEQAIAVAKLNIALKLLHAPEKLPMLTNLRVGNSLVSGSSENLKAVFGDNWSLQKAFEWHEEFPEVFEQGGFDIIIGNPPYVRQEVLGEAFKTYAQQTFSTYTGTADLYIYFIEQAHRLLKPGGYFGMICSNKFMRSNYGKALREFLTAQAEILEIVDFGELPVFETASTFPVILVTRKRKPLTEKTSQDNVPRPQNFIYAPIKSLSFDTLGSEVEKTRMVLNEQALVGEVWALTDKQEQVVLEKMKRIGVPLGSYVNGEILRGIITGLTDAFVIDQFTRDRIILEDPKSGELIKPFVVGNDVRKYHINNNHTYLICIPKGWTNSTKPEREDAWEWFQQTYPALVRHLKPYIEPAQKRLDKGDYWWELRACDYYDQFEKPKIVYPEIGRESRFAFDEDNNYTNNKAFIIPRYDLYLLGILNSKISWLFLKRSVSVLGDPDKGGRLMLQTVFFKNLPIRAVDLNRPADKKLHDRIVALVQEILKLQKEHAEAEQAWFDIRHDLKPRIAALDWEIDQLVYQLYGLNENEIAVVEGKVGEFGPYAPRKEHTVSQALLHD